MVEAERANFHTDFARALAFATDLHARQVRKETDIPYISHLIAVAGLVLENGGTRDEAIAALLHDSIEDQSDHYPGKALALKNRIGTEFGSTVLSIVEDCSDAETIPKPPWKTRKESYIQHLKTLPPSSRLVSCADKLHNARAIVADLRVMGLSLFERFNGGKDGTLWYYRALAEEFSERGPDRLSEELCRVVETMEALAKNQQ